MLFFYYFILECPRNCRRCLSETTCSGASESCENAFVWSSAERACIGKKNLQ